MTVAQPLPTGKVRRTVGAPHFQLYVSADRGLVNWRLLSGNNRDLGRSVPAYDTVEEAKAAIAELVTGLNSLLGYVRPAGEHRWVWTLRLGTIFVATSGHQYDRQVRCEAARRQFISYAAIAAVDTEVMYVRQRRSLGVTTLTF